MTLTLQPCLSVEQSFCQALAMPKQRSVSPAVAAVAPGENAATDLYMP